MPIAIIPIFLLLFYAGTSESAETSAVRQFVLELDGKLIDVVKIAALGETEDGLDAFHAGDASDTNEAASLMADDPFFFDIPAVATSGPFLEWIQTSFSDEYDTRSAIIHACNAKFESMAVRQFTNATIAEINISPLDRNSKAPVYFGFAIDFEKAMYKPGDDTVIALEESDKNSMWRRGNFRIELGDLPCNQIRQITFPTIVPGETHSLELTIAKTDAKAWMDWYQGFVIDGQCADGDELEGQITFFASDMETVLGSIDLASSCPVALELNEGQANADGVESFTVHLAVKELAIESLEIAHE